MGVSAWALRGQFEHFVDELDPGAPNIIPAHPSNLSLSQHVDRCNPESFSAQREIPGIPA